MIARKHTLWIWFLMAANIVFSAAMYARLPDPAPLHWNIHGQIDGYGPRWVAAGLFPACMAFVMLLLVLLPKLGPFRSNLESIATTYGAAWKRPTLLLGGRLLKFGAQVDW